MARPAVPCEARQAFEIALGAKLAAKAPTRGMEDPSHFTSDLVDFNSIDPYPDTLEDEVVVASTELLPTHHSYSSINPAVIPSPRSSLGRSPVMPFRDISYSDQVCDPSLLANKETVSTRSKVSEPLTPASFEARGSISTKSSSNSIPSLQESHIMPSARKPSHGDSEPPKKRARQKQSKSTKQESEDEEEEDESTEKRKKFLEKNRIAASKCREKKKKWVHELEYNKSQLERQNMELRLEHRGLMSELNQTKSMLMSHADCNDPNITEWLNNQARRIVQTTGSSMFSMPNPLSAYPPQGQHRNDSNISGSSLVDLVPASRRASTAYSQGEYSMTG